MSLQDRGSGADDAKVERGHLAIRAPRPVRIYVIAFMSVWCGGVLVAFVVTLAARSAAAPFTLGMLAFGLGLGYRLFNLSVVGTADELVVRNYLSTRRVPKSQVEGFRIGSPAMNSAGKSIVVLLRDDTVLSMDVTSRPARLSGGRRKLEAQLSELRSWLAA